MSTVLKPKFQHEWHIWERVKTKKHLYRCIHPDCPTYKNKEMLTGKRAECPKCHELYILTYEKLRNKLPTCDMCSKSPKAKELREKKEAADELLRNLQLPDDIRSILE